VLKPLNPEFKPIVLTVDDEGAVDVVAELVEVLVSELTSRPPVASGVIRPGDSTGRETRGGVDR
jgi:hypothetical protein